MNILITNDDGISCNGIIALEKAFKKKHKTFLIAPLKERSATSMALSIYDKMRVEKVYDDHYIVDGYPVDCVNIGLHGEIFPKIDLVISGINRGVNMGHDVHYSGTVGAARHAAVHGFLAIAVSSGKINIDSDYSREAELLLELLETKPETFKKGIVYNLNFPQEYKPSLSEIKAARLGKRTYFDTYTRTPIIGGIFDFFLGGSELGHIKESGTDFEAYYMNKISITPISLDPTEKPELEILKNMFP